MAIPWLYHTDRGILSVVYMLSSPQTTGITDLYVGSLSDNLSRTMLYKALIINCQC